MEPILKHWLDETSAIDRLNIRLKIELQMVQAVVVATTPF